MLLYCIRHGESCYNAEGRIQGQSPTPLSTLGLQQAQAVAAALAASEVEAVYSSPLPRAFQTAEPLAAALGVPVRTDDRLMEIHVGIFQNLLHAEVADVHPEATARWRSADPDYRIPGGESRRELMARALAAFEAIRAAGHRRAAVVSHGGLLAAAFKALLQIPPESNPFSLYNASISQLAWSGPAKLLTLNQTDHLRGTNCEVISTRGDFFDRHQV